MSTALSNVDSLLNAATEQYARSRSDGGACWLVAIPTFPDGSRIDNKCEDNDPDWGKMSNGVVRLPAACMRCLSGTTKFNGLLYRLMAFSTRGHQPTELNEFIAFAAKAGATFHATPPRWSISVVAGDARTMWVAALLFLFPEYSTTRHDCLLITHPWAASIAALRSWDKPPTLGTPPVWISYDEAMLILGLSRTRISDYVKNGDLAHNGLAGKKKKVSAASVALLKLQLEKERFQEKGRSVSETDHENEGPSMDVVPRPTLDALAEKARKGESLK